MMLPLQLQNARQEDVPEEWLGVHSLIVDDDRQTCENAAALLEDMGLRPEFVTEGEEAVRRVVPGQGHAGSIYPGDHRLEDARNGRGGGHQTDPAGKWGMRFRSLS